MEAGEWFKQFGSREERFDTLETYYHIVEARDGYLFINEYNYYSHFGKLILVNKKPYTYSEKDWMEEIIKNNVYALKKEALPFYLTM
jgi:hypothetical protein